MAVTVFNYHGKNYMIDPATGQRSMPPQKAPSHVGNRELWIKIQIAWGIAHGLSREQIIQKLDRGLASTAII